MTKRALLIGSQTFGLEGCRRDLALMNACLAERGFVVEILEGECATRSGILHGFRTLIEETHSGDAVVIYYSGHGGLARNPAWRARDPVEPWQPRFFQLIVPTDMDRSGERDFRGILNLELSLLLARLTRKTQNATVILDCCHSTTMFRGMRPRSLKKPWYHGVGEHLSRLREQMGPDWREAEGNPHAVRLTASGRHQSAYEYPGRDGGPVGIFTETLAAALREIEGHPVSWSGLMKGIRERVLVKQPWQRPELEGPGHRLPFETGEVFQAGVLTYFVGGSPFFPLPSLRGGRLLGVENGSVYGLMPRRSERWSPEKQLGRATVTEVFGGISRVTLNVPHLPPGLPAFPLETPLKPRPVALLGEPVPDLRRSIAHSKHLRLAASGEIVVATVRASNGIMEVYDGFSSLLTEPLSDVRQVVDSLTQLARSLSLRELEGGEGKYALPEPFEVTWGRVVEGRAVPVKKDGANFFVGDRIYARVANRGGETLYANLIEIGVSHRIYVLNRARPSGIEVLPDSEECLGFRSFDGLVGLKMGWPQAVPPDGPRPATWLAVISDRPQDLTVLESRGVAFPRDSDASLLQRMLQQIRLGTRLKRYRNEETRADVRYAVCKTNFLLHPMERQVEGKPEPWKGLRESR